jgi:hypothetical protein
VNVLVLEDNFLNKEGIIWLLLVAAEE